MPTLPICHASTTAPNASTKPKNVLFTEAELGSHVLCMCPLQWQDQCKMNKKGMTLMDMRLLLTLLEAIKSICTNKKGKSESPEKYSNKGRKGKKCPGTDSTARVPKKVHFEKHCMCPLQWQDQCKMNKKRMMPMDMCSLLTLLKAIKCICTYKKSKSESLEKSSNKGKKGKKRPGTYSTARLPKKVHFEKHCNLMCKKHGGTFIMHHFCDCCSFEKDGKEKSNFRAAKKG
jgi:hypothetical protein